MKNYRWLTELLSPEEGHFVSIREFLFSTTTEYQSLDILELGDYGKCLVLDGRLQSTLADEFIYHEALVHPPLLLHPNPERVFIVGGGEGATLREVLRHQSVRKALMVDIDREVVSRCKELLPEFHQGSFDDPRAVLEFTDARRYLEENSDTFDVILIDISEPVEEGPAYLLFTREFYQLVKERLNRPGLIALQAGAATCIGVAGECFSAVYNTLKSVFPSVSAYMASVPSFSIPWGFCLASPEPGLDPLSVGDVDVLIRSRIEGELRFYDQLAHQSMFSLPKHIRTRLAEEQRLIEDNAPLFTYR